MNRIQFIADKKLLKVLIEINKWENEELKQFKNLAAREIYFSIAEDLLLKDNHKRSIKQQIRSKNCTERASRINIRKLEKNGILESKKIQNDARRKKIIPTHVFLEKLNEHLKAIKSICKEEFHMIEND